MKKVLSIALLAAAPVLAQAQSTIFADDFNANAVGPNLAPTGWTVTNGTVDIVGPGFFGGLCAAGGDKCIDLDGSTNDAGVLSHDFSLTAGITYTATFELAGNQRGGKDRITVSFGSSVFTFAALAANTAWSNYEVEFTPTSSGIYALSFSNAGGDNIGAVLDNVAIQAVPEPETYAMLLAGLGLMGTIARRKAKKTA
jgi:Protein of unknown function (DUF642)/PEP-CTERM motif